MIYVVLTRWLIISGLFTGFYFLYSEVQPDRIDMNTKHQTEPAKLKVVVGSEIFTATLFDNPTSKSLLEQLPMKIAMEDYAGMEKIFYPPKALSKEGAPHGAAPESGDIMYYAPWGDVAIFYQDFRRSPGLIPMGRLEDVEAFSKAIGSGKEVSILKN